MWLMERKKKLYSWLGVWSTFKAALNSINFCDTYRRGERLGIIAYKLRLSFIRHKSLKIVCNLEVVFSVGLISKLDLKTMIWTFQCSIEFPPSLLSLEGMIVYECTSYPSNIKTWPPICLLLIHRKQPWVDQLKWTSNKLGRGMCHEFMLCKDPSDAHIFGMILCDGWKLKPHIWSLNVQFTFYYNTCTHRRSWPKL
jgi:hypothetical protein